MEIYKNSICIVSHNAYGMISGGIKGAVGGVEWQTSLMAKWFVENKYKVSLLTWNEGNSDDEIINGVRVIKICKKNAGLTCLRFIHPKWSGLIKALRKSDANIYYQNCGECVTGQMALWCRLNKRPMVFSVASNADCIPTFPELYGLKDKVLYKYGLRHVNKRIVQTNTQKGMLKKYFGLESQLIPMPCLGPSSSEWKIPINKNGNILWIGRVCKVKRPDRILEIARLCPEYRFDVVGPLYDDEYSISTIEGMKKYRNIKYHGPIEKSKVNQFYKNASCLCCTSEYEGFPNTFLEAWSHGLPIVSTFDPDGIIASQRLGITYKDVSELAIGIKKLFQNEILFKQYSNNTRKYYEDNHRIECVMPKYEKLFKDLIDGNNKKS